MADNRLEKMSFLNHLEELRWHLIRMFLAVSIFGISAFTFKRFIFDIIIFGPKDPRFITYRFLCNMSQALHMKDALCIQELPINIQNRTMSGQFSAHLWMAIWSGFVVGFPYITYEIWRFIRPGLYDDERKSARGFILITSMLFFLGVLFGYYIICPLSINFLSNYNISSSIENHIDLGSYIGLVRASVLSSGIIFELPVIVYFLTKIGVINPEFLKKYRKHALIVVLVVSAIITPPDITSQIIVTIPVLILYEVSIFISKRVTKKTHKHPI